MLTRESPLKSVDASMAELTKGIIGRRNRLTFLMVLLSQHKLYDLGNCLILPGWRIPGPS